MDVFSVEHNKHIDEFQILSNGTTIKTADAERVVDVLWEWLKREAE